MKPQEKKTSVKPDLSKPYKNILSDSEYNSPTRAQWPCSKCTFINESNIMNCLACNSIRPGQSDKSEELNTSNDFENKEFQKCIRCDEIVRSVEDFIIISCSHKLCRQCVEVQYTKEINSFHCTVEMCKGEILDSELRRILQPDKYRDLEVALMKKLEISNFQLPVVGWRCNACTFVNKPFFQFCSACNDNRPQNYAEPQFYKPSFNDEKLRKRLEDEDKERKQKDKEQQEKEEFEKSNNLQNLINIVKQDVAEYSENCECPICYADCQAGEAVILHSCLHTVCKTCLRDYLLNSTNPLIKCPMENCMGMLEDREIEKMLGPVDFAKYQEMSMRTAEATERNSFHCKSPNCQAWIVHDDYLDNFDCPICKKNNCIRCNTIHHPMKCSDYQMSLLTNKDQSTKLDEEYFEKMINLGLAMKCPGCGILVEKDQGCDWIRCKKCNTEMCWATKGPRWGPKGPGDTTGGCRCKVEGKKCHPKCRYCH